MKHDEDKLEELDGGGPYEVDDFKVEKVWDKQTLELLYSEVDDFLNSRKRPLKPPRGPIVRPRPGNPKPPEGAQPQEDGQPPNGPYVIPCRNVIIDDSDGPNGRPPGGGGQPGKGKIIEIPPNLKNCVLTQHHTADNGDGWVVLIEIKNGRIKRVRGFDEHGNGKSISRRVGKIIKVHKDNNKITVVGTRRSCTYFVKTNQLLCFPQ